MCKKWAYYVRFACVLFCISCTLFLNTLHVDAATLSFSHRFIMHNIAEPVYNSSTTSGRTTGTITNYVGYSDDIVIPFTVTSPKMNVLSTDEHANLSFPVSFSFSSTYGSWDSAYLTLGGDYVGKVSTSSTSYSLKYETISKYRSFRFSTYSGSTPIYNLWYTLPFELHLHCFYSGVVTTTSGSNIGSQLYDDVTITINYPNTSDVNNTSVTNAREPVESTRDVNSEDIKNATQETAETTSSIFSSISDFFGSFFENLIGIFVPDDDFFTTWFNSLNTLLTDKLGILYYPFSVIINFLNRCTTAFANQGTGTDIVFPAIEFTNAATNETYTFLSAQHINLADFNVTTSSSPNSSLVGSSGFGSLVDIIRTFNAFVILFCLLSLLRTKLNLILREDNNDN